MARRPHSRTHKRHRLRRTTHNSLHHKLIKKPRRRQSKQITHNPDRPNRIHIHPLEHLGGTITRSPPRRSNNHTVRHHRIVPSQPDADRKPLDTDHNHV